MATAMGATGEVIQLSRDVSWGRIEFEERPETAERRAYRAYHVTCNGTRERYPSVTTVIGRIAPKQSLLNWYEARGAEGAVIVGRAGLLRGVEAADAIEVVRSNGAGAGGRSDEAKLRGKALHAALEAWARDGTVANPADYPPEWRGYLRGLVGWLLEAEPVPHQVEQLVAHPSLGYAGRFDLRAYVDGLDTIVDLKTRERARLYPDDATQLAAYDLAAHICGDPLAAQCLAVSIGADGSHEAKLVPDEFREAWHRGALYHGAQQAALRAFDGGNPRRREAAA